MPGESCPDCGAERYLYRSDCVACQVRLYARVHTQDGREHVVVLLRDLEDRRGREHAERVRDLALRQRGKGPRVGA